MVLQPEIARRMGVIRVDVTRWLSTLNAGGQSHSVLSYKDRDGRELALEGRLRSLEPQEQMECWLTLHPERSLEASFAQCDGFAIIRPEQNGQERRLVVDVDLPKPLWEELWARSRTPPPAGLVAFTLSDQPTEVRLPIKGCREVRDPLIRLASS